MSYTNDLIKFARQLEQPLAVERDDKTNRYKVSVPMVGFKNGYLRQNVFGLGFTIEDACCDFIRKCRGGQIYHYITEQTVDVI